MDKFKCAFCCELFEIYVFVIAYCVGCTYI